MKNSLMKISLQNKIFDEKKIFDENDQIIKILMKNSFDEQFQCKNL